jgi:SulP family sulfate permease
MIFGVAQAIAQERKSLDEARVLILDLTDVPLLSTTVALALENVVREARSFEVAVLVCTGSEEIRQRLERIESTSSNGLQFCSSRLTALQEASVLAIAPESI